MSQDPQHPSDFSFVGWLATSSGLVGAALFFTGWIYRWFYFNFFQLEVTTLDLPLQSFLFVPIQVLLGNPIAFLRALVAGVLAAIAIRLNFWLIREPNPEPPSNTEPEPKPEPKPDAKAVKKPTKGQQLVVGAAQKLRSLLKLLRSRVQIFPPPLVKGLMVVAWVLVCLFWLARIQGIADGRRDAFNNTSSLPVITFVTPEERLALGRKLNNMFVAPTLSGFRVIGDRGLFDKLRTAGEITDTSNPDRPIVWRLLIDRNGYFYIFQSLTSKSRDRRPIVLVIQESMLGDQLLILSPEASQPPSQSQ